MRSRGWASVRRAEIMDRANLHLYRCHFCNCHGVPKEWNDPESRPLEKCPDCLRRFCSDHIDAQEHHCPWADQPNGDEET